MITNINMNELLAIPLEITPIARPREVKAYFVNKVSKDYPNSPVIAYTRSYKLLMFPIQGNYKGARICVGHKRNLIELIQKYTPFNEKSLDGLYKEACNKGYVMRELQELNIDGWWDDILQVYPTKGKPIVYVENMLKGTELQI